MGVEAPSSQGPLTQNRRGRRRQGHLSLRADLASDAEIGPGTQVWDGATVRSGARIGADCVLGRGVYVGPGVQMGDSCKVQNDALIYEPAVLENGVFVGPAVVFTNDLFPRAVNPDRSPKDASDWVALPVVVREGASIGARAVCVAPVTIGRWAMVAAGAVVTQDVPDHALVAGVPAKQRGWVGRAGQRLDPQGDGVWSCPVTGTTYVERFGRLTEQ